MQIIFVSSIVTLAFVLINIFFLNRRLNPIAYAYMFFAILILRLLCCVSFCLSCEVSFFHGTFIQEAMTPTQRIEYTKKRQYHWEKANETFNLAKSKSRLIPDWQDKELAEQLFDSCMAAILTPGTMKAKAVGGLMWSLYKYSMHMYTQWGEMDRLLHESEYNFEMFEFYVQVLNKG